MYKRLNLAKIMIHSMFIKKYKLRRQNSFIKIISSLNLEINNLDKFIAIYEL